MKLKLSTLFCGLYLIVTHSQLIAQGSLLLVGGGSENYNSWSDAPYGWFVSRADSGKIVNIDADATSSWYPNYFKSLGASGDSKMLQIANRTAANDSAVYKELISADGIFMEGGDQYDYISNWKGTLVEDAIHAVFNKGGAIGGTSAGLAVIGEIVFSARYGSAYPEETAYNPYDSAIQFEDDFLHILPNVLTDSHFYSRGRIGRLVPMLARRIQDNGEGTITGIGISDKTALCIESDLTANAYGMATVTVLYAKAKSFISCQRNQPLTFTNIGFDQLIDGVTYDLKTHQLIDPGADLEEIDYSSPAVAYVDTFLDGSDVTASNMGEIIINNIYGDDLNAWYGHLDQSPGDKIVPNAIIIPAIWALEDDSNPRLYFENRWIAGLFGLAHNSSYSTIYMDINSSVSVYQNGEIESNSLLYVLDMKQATHAGFTSSRNTDFPGIIGAELHFLGEGQRYNLNVQNPVLDIKKSRKSLPDKSHLEKLYPNPFNSDLMIQYQIAKKGKIKIEIYDIVGNKISTLTESIHQPGSYKLHWRANQMSSGLYFVKLSTAKHIQSSKVILVK
jgi:cyanophycinase